MKLTLTRLLAAAWWLFRRERPLILALAAPFVFLPNYAVLLLCDPLPTLPRGARDEAVMSRWIAQVGQWAGSNGSWYLVADAVELFGLAALALLLVGAGRPTVGAAMAGAGRRYLTYALLSILSALPVALGLWLFVLPGLYAQARLVAAVPALAADERLGVWQALRRSLRLTRGDGWALTGATLTLFLAQWFAVMPLLTVDDWLRETAHANPVLLALVDAALAALGAGWRVALVLLGVAVYRVRVRSGT